SGEVCVNAAGLRRGLECTERPGEDEVPAGLRETDAGRIQVVDLGLPRTERVVVHGYLVNRAIERQKCGISAMAENHRTSGGRIAIDAVGNEAKRTPILGSAQHAVHIKTNGGEIVRDDDVIPTVRDERNVKEVAVETAARSAVEQVHGPCAGSVLVKIPAGDAAGRHVHGGHHGCEITGLRRGIDPRFNRPWPCNWIEFERIGDLNGCSTGEPEGDVGAVRYTTRSLDAKRPRSLDIGA